jgi:hypothetical protein
MHPKRDASEVRVCLYHLYTLTHPHTTSHHVTSLLAIRLHRLTSSEREPGGTRACVRASAHVDGLHACTSAHACMRTRVHLRYAPAFPATRNAGRVRMQCRACLRARHVHVSIYLCVYACVYLYMHVCTYVCGTDATMQGVCMCLSIYLSALILPKPFQYQTHSIDERAHQVGMHKVRNGALGGAAGLQVGRFGKEGKFHHGKRR